MSVLKGILSESQEYYLSIKKRIKRKLADLPNGSVKERNISGKKYYYLQKRIGDKIIHEYLGRGKPEDLIKKIKMRKSLKLELRKVEESLKILKRAKGNGRG